MSTLLRKVNPFVQLDSLVTQGLAYVGDNLGTLTTERLHLSIGQYIDSHVVLILQSPEPLIHRKLPFLGQNE